MSVETITAACALLALLVSIGAILFQAGKNQQIQTELKEQVDGLGRKSERRYKRTMALLNDWADNDEQRKQVSSILRDD